jgi:hypothetical protein
VDAVDLFTQLLYFLEKLVVLLDCHRGVVAVSLLVKLCIANLLLGRLILLDQLIKLFEFKATS